MFMCYKKTKNTKVSRGKETRKGAVGDGFVRTGRC